MRHRLRNNHNHHYLYGVHLNKENEMDTQKTIEDMKLIERATKLELACIGLTLAVCVLVFAAVIAEDWIEWMPAIIASVTALVVLVRKLYQLDKEEDLDSIGAESTPSVYPCHNRGACGHNMPESDPGCCGCMDR